MPDFTPVSVRARVSEEPVPGIRHGNVVAYDYDVPLKWLREVVPMPEGPLTQRSFVILDERVQLTQPVSWPSAMTGWWYVDLVSVEDRGTELTITDDYLDVIAGPYAKPYRILDLHEYAEALALGHRTAEQVAAGMTAFQTFLDRHLNVIEPATAWPDFPPAVLEPLRGASIR